MQKDADRWKEYWNTRSQEGVSSHEVDRGHSPHDRKIEDIVEQDFLAFVDPQRPEYILDAGCGSGHQSLLAYIHALAAWLGSIAYQE